MTGETHTLISVGCLFVAFLIGRIFGQKESYLLGFDEGVNQGVNSAMQSLKYYGISIEYNVEIVDEEPENKE